MTLRLAVTGTHLEGFSGLPRNLVTALREECDVRAWPLPTYQPPVAKRGLMRARRFLGRDYLWEKDPARCQFLSRAIDQRASEESVDAILVIGSESCAFCTTSVPLFGFGDSIFGSRLDLYADQVSSRISARSMAEGIAVQQRALDRMRVYFITSQWAWDRAVARLRYATDAARVDVVLAGANLPHVAVAPPTPADRSPCLIWVGVDWVRKRGDLAVAAVAAMRDSGVDARLDVVGPVTVPSPPHFVTAHGRLDAASGLGDVYARSSALLLPTAADLTPVVIAEAAMYGRATFASPAGGIPEMIRDGVDGVLVDSDDPRVWAAALRGSLSGDALMTMGRAARASYEQRLNWRVIARRIIARIESVS